jgi:hypothetical protein
MATFVKFNQFVEDLGSGVHQLHAGGHTLKVYLTNATPDVVNDAVKADLAEIAAEHGYPAGGTDVQNDLVVSGGSGTVTGTDVVFTAAGGTFGPARYAVLYNDTPAAPEDPLIGYWDFESSRTPTTGETFPVEFGGSIFSLSALTSTGERFPRLSGPFQVSPYNASTWYGYPSGTNLNKVCANDGLYVRTWLLHVTTLSALMIGYNFDFSDIPSTATLRGFICRYEASKFLTFATSDVTLCQLVIGTTYPTTLLGDNQYVAVPQRLNSVEVVYAVGSDSNVWGTALNASSVTTSLTSIRNPRFGVALGLTGTAENCQAIIDYLTLEVFYTN